ncbi:MAG: hypothetical protein JXJ17_00075 [Anaerolineae bacterium]|nr:hypothetical protein [Anaerolineae bacterium]
MTAQVHEQIIIDGELTTMAFCPPIPENHSRIVEIPYEEARSKADSHIVFTTACWRKYIGTWEIRDGRFYLTDIQGRYELTGDDPLLADWFSGVLRVPRGEMLHYVHMGFGSIYEEEIHIKIEAGEVIDFRVIDNRRKIVDLWEVEWRNLPGGENRFDGDEEMQTNPQNKFCGY